MNPEIVELEALIEDLLGILQSTIANGEVLSDEFQGVIARELEVSLRRIEELRGQLEPEEQGPENPADGLPPPIPPNPSVPTGGDVPPLEAAPYESSNINGFRYNPTNGQLYVKFQDKYPGQNGPVYKYEGVPLHLYNVFSRGAVAPRTSGANAWHRWQEGVAPSHGAAMYALIREGGYPYQRVR